MHILELCKLGRQLQGLRPLFREVPFPPCYGVFGRLQGFLHQGLLCLVLGDFHSFQLSLLRFILVYRLCKSGYDGGLSLPWGCYCHAVQAQRLFPVWRDLHGEF